MNKKDEILNELEKIYEDDSYNENIDTISNNNSNSIKEDNDIETSKNNNNTTNENNINSAINNQSQDNKKDNIKNKKLSMKIKNDTFDNLILVLILLGLFSLLDTQKNLLEVEKNVPKWEYQTIYLDATESTKYIKSELNSSKINLSGDMINEYGLVGWELVDTYLEMETVHPNYGNSDYVTGLQPNIRPQRLVLVFKRPL